MLFSDLIHVLQAAVSPVVLISGVGLLILSMTNRLARVVDRSRQMGHSRHGIPDDEARRVEPQLRILVRRARLLRRAISCATFSVLLAAILVIVLFLSAYLRVEVVLISVVFFVFCLVSLIAGVISFLQDIHLSLVALDMELGLDVDVDGPKPSK